MNILYKFLKHIFQNKGYTIFKISFLIYKIFIIFSIIILTLSHYGSIFDKIIIFFYTLLFSAFSMLHLYYAFIIEKLNHEERSMVIGAAFIECLFVGLILFCLGVEYLILKFKNSK